MFASANEAGDIAAFVLGLRDERVFDSAATTIPLNGVWGFAHATRVGPGRYKALHNGGVLRLDAEGGSPAKCIYQVKFTMMTASPLENTEVWTLDLTEAELSVERRATGQLKGIGLRVRANNAFCFKSSMRPDACTGSQLFDDHTPGLTDADLDRKTLELQAVIERIKAAGCGRPSP